MRSRILQVKLNRATKVVEENSSDFILWMGVLLLGGLALFMSFRGADYEEVRYCESLRAQAHEFKNFTLTDLDKTMCEYRGVEIYN